MNSVYAKACELEHSGIPFVMVTMLSHRGHAPQDPGAKAIVTKVGLEAGTVGGGKVEAKAIAHAQSLLNNDAIDESELITEQKWNLQKDVGMTCGGEVEFLFEISTTQNWQIVVYGAGHVAQALVPVLLNLNCKVYCIDQRQDWLDRLPSAGAKLEKICAPVLESTLSQLPRKAFYVLMTQGHSTDYPILEKMLKDFLPPYVGVLGSPVKSKKVRAELKDAGVAPESIDALCCPMGLPLGTNEPAEMAISITAQLLERRAEVFNEEKWRKS